MKRTHVCLLALVIAGCGAQLRQFPLRAPLRVDPDQTPFSGKPEEYDSPFAWDAADNTVFRPISEFFAVEQDTPSINVNALDEIPDSSWFTNRIGVRAMTPEEIALGPCETGTVLDPESGPWMVTGAKPNGENPGFLVRAEDGTQFLLKFDGTVQPERATSADVIGTRVYHAAGYFTPCNSIVFFDRSILRIAPDAEAEGPGGRDEPMTEAHLEKIFERAFKNRDGMYRANASRFLPGEPIGPWRYEDVRDDDPNDVIPHEHRRELRGMVVLAAWLNHFDSREQNTLATWMPAGRNRGYVRHNMLDFGDCLGSLWDWEMLSRRLGHSHYLDVEQILVDLATFGAVSRPWDDDRPSPIGHAFGYFDVQRFEADEWRPGYPNPAFSRAEERDAAWMARILARFRYEHVEALVNTAHLERPDARRVLTAVLEGRKRKLLARYLSRVSPLADARVDTEGRLCMRDLAVDSQIVRADTRTYGARAWVDHSPEDRVLGRLQRDGDGQLCLTLPRVREATSLQPKYMIVDVTTNAEHTGPLRAHLYDVGVHGHRLVGIERPDEHTSPYD